MNKERGIIIGLGILFLVGSVNAYLLVINNSGGNFDWDDGSYINTVVKKSTEELQLKWKIDNWNAYYTFDKNSGNIAYDESDNNNYCTIYGATWSNGRYNKGLKLDGINDYLNCGSSNSLNITKAISMGLDLKLDSYSTSPNIIHKYIMNIGYMLALGNNNGRINSYIKSGGNYSTTTPYIFKDKWQHIFTTWNYSGDNKIRIYVNGILKETSTAIFPLNYTPNVPLKISGTLGGFSYLNGTIENLRIYDYALNSTEVLSISKNEHEDFGFWEIEHSCLFGDVVRNVSFDLEHNLYTRIDFYLNDVLIQNDVQNNIWYDIPNQGDRIKLKFRTVNKSLTPTLNKIIYNCDSSIPTTTTTAPQYNLTPVVDTIGGGVDIGYSILDLIITWLPAIIVMMIFGLVFGVFERYV